MGGSYGDLFLTVHVHCSLFRHPARSGYPPLPVSYVALHLAFLTSHVSPQPKGSAQGIACLPLVPGIPELPFMFLWQWEIQRLISLCQLCLSLPVNENLIGFWVSRVCWKLIRQGLSPVCLSLTSSLCCFLLLHLCSVLLLSLFHFCPSPLNPYFFLCLHVLSYPLLSAPDLNICE